MGSPNASTCRVRWPRRANGGVSPRCPPSRTDTKLATARARISAVRRHQTSRRFPQSGTASAKFLPVTEKVHGDQTSQKKNMTEPHAMTGNGDATADSRSPQETVLVTGGSGFLGSWTVVELLRRTYSVRTTIRDLTRAPQVRAMVATEVDPGDRLRFVQADLLKDQGWDEATADADFVLHIASPMPVGEFRGQDVITPAREGTLRVLVRHAKQRSNAWSSPLPRQQPRHRPGPPVSSVMKQSGPTCPPNRSIITRGRRRWRNKMPGRTCAITAV